MFKMSKKDKNKEVEDSQLDTQDTATVETEAQTKDELTIEEQLQERFGQGER